MATDSASVVLASFKSNLRYSMRTSGSLAVVESERYCTMTGMENFIYITAFYFCY